MGMILWGLFIAVMVGAFGLFIIKRPRNPTDYSSKVNIRIWRTVLVWVGTLLLLGSYAVQSPDIPEIYKSWTPIGRVLADAPDFWMTLGMLSSMLGCYLWAKYKSQGGWRAIFGLLSIIGFFILMVSKDYHVFPEEQRPDIA
jgi:hypothetical protein